MRLDRLLAYTLIQSATIPVPAPTQPAKVQLHGKQKILP